MGGLSSRPSAPQIQYVAQPAPQPVAAPQGEQKQGDGDAKASAEVRRDDLLRRQRGRSGTILTGYRGLTDVSKSAAQAGRKTLLGE